MPAALERYLRPRVFGLCRETLGFQNQVGSYFFQLAQKPQAERLVMVEALRDKAPYFLLVDWQMAERNICVPFCLARNTLFLLQEPPKNRHYKAYLADGALEQVLYSLRDSATVLRRESLLCGTVGMAIGKWV